MVIDKLATELTFRGAELDDLEDDLHEEVESEPGEQHDELVASHRPVDEYVRAAQKHSHGCSTHREQRCSFPSNSSSPKDQEDC